MARPRSPKEGATEAVEAVLALKKRTGWIDKELAARIGADQSSVYRALNRVPPAWTPTLRKLWDYAETLRRSRRARAARDSALTGVLTKAVIDAWDGTSSGLDRLVRFLHIFAEMWRRPDAGR